MSVKTIPELECIHTFSVQGSQDEYFNAINSIAISPDKTKIAATGDKFRQPSTQWNFTCWDLSTGQVQDIASAINYKTHQSHLQSLDFSIDSRFIALSSTDQTSQYHDYPSLSFWSVDSIPNHSIQKPEGGGIFVIVSHPTELQFATIDLQGIIRLWHDYHQTGELHEIKSWQAHNNRGYSFISDALKFSLDGKFLYSVGSDQLIKRWCAITGDLIFSFPTKQHQNIRALAVSPNNEIVVGGSDQRIRIWNSKTGQMYHSFFGHADWVRGVAITPDNQFLISTGDTKIKIWDLESGKKLKTIMAHADAIRGMAMSHDAQILVTGSRDGVVKVWHIQF